MDIINVFALYNNKTRKCVSLHWCVYSWANVRVTG